MLIERLQRGDRIGFKTNGQFQVGEFVQMQDGVLVVVMGDPKDGRSDRLIPIRQDEVLAPF